MEEAQFRFITGLKAGDKKIFEELYREYYTPLCFYCLRFVGKHEEAEEIVQGVFFKIWLKREELNINSSLKSYLYRSVQNYAINHLNLQKSRGRYHLDDYTETEEPNINGLEMLEEDELNTRIKEAIARLPERRRIIFELSRFSDLKYHQIADQLEISVKTVEAQMAKALQSLRETLKDYLPMLGIMFFIILHT
ncbi:MAG: RNA polymerase sigma-70 factor [Bacteroidales bacterium]|nr:RNA polymerase sigma-70 factor [Bacteroidales bacterium]